MSNVTFSDGRCGEGPITTTILPPSPPSPNSSNIGMIVGICIAIAVVINFVAYFIYAQCKKSSNPEQKKLIEKRKSVENVIANENTTA